MLRRYWKNYQKYLEIWKHTKDITKTTADAIFKLGCIVQQSSASDGKFGLVFRAEDREVLGAASSSLATWRHFDAGDASTLPAAGSPATGDASTLPATAFSDAVSNAAHADCLWFLEILRRSQLRRRCE